MIINFVWKIKREILERKRGWEHEFFFFNICKIIFLIKKRESLFYLIWVFLSHRQYFLLLTIDIRA